MTLRSHSPTCMGRSFGFVVQAPVAAALLVRVVTSALSPSCMVVSVSLAAVCCCLPTAGCCSAALPGPGP
eukprot:10911342-Lingulodinium_polyedra.AAC.1